MQKRRAWIEAAFALAAGVVGVVTVIFPTWFEAMFEASPDEGSGALEIGIAIALILASLVLAAMAVRDFGRLRASRTDS
jgi:amino acid transporter